MRVNASLLLSAPYVSARYLRRGPLARAWRRAGRLVRRLGMDVADGILTERVAEVPEFIRRVAAAAPRTPILDVGCASSYMPFHYLAMGFEVHGIDLRDPQIDARGFRFILGDVARIELPASYEVITLLSTLEHCGAEEHYGGESASNDFAAIANLRRFLVPGGRFICSVPYGRPTDMGWFRVYDDERLSRVFGSVRGERFYRFETPAWYPCSREDVADEPVPSVVES